MSINLEERRRVTEPNHIRTVEVQALDALIRIDETLTSILEGMRHLAKQLKTAEPAAPEETPAPKAKVRK
ncbi:hypothetical protein [Tardiphaga sp. 367_B4_N1_1]|uniref:hypothetical protein n=1 Tax=Tardiphaga sp. 367_B4_N1_1 TaxID=3240777 RepID=UPI003F22ACD7